MALQETKEGAVFTKQAQTAFHIHFSLLDTKGKPSTRSCKKELPELAIKAAAALAQNKEPLTKIIEGNSNHAKFCRRVLGRVLSYAASLLPTVTETPQDIDDAMKLGFNCQRGPFELMMPSYSKMKELLKEAGVKTPDALQHDQPFYKVDGSALTVRHADKKYKPFSLPPGVIRFQMKRRTMTPIFGK